MKILFAGGGTGGHVYPAIAIANKIKAINPQAEILFVGTSNGIESEIVPKSGYPFKTITVQGFKRKLDLDNIKRGIKLTKGLLDAKRIINEFKPDIVIGTGGYVSGPILFCANEKKVLTVIHEQNSFPGVTNKILSKKVDLIITCFEDAKSRFPKNAQKRIVLLGNPVREELLSINKSDARKNLNIPNNKKMVLIYGGSGGFKKMNESVTPMIQELVKRDIAFIYATGKRFYDECIESLKNIQLKEYQKIVPYLDDMTNSLSACDIVVGSAGATSLAEITALGKPSIIIPKAYTAENHQEFNAKSISDNGAGIHILESEINSNLLQSKLFNILDDDKKLRKMEINSRKLGNPEAVDDIYMTIVNFKKMK